MKSKAARIAWVVIVGLWLTGSLASAQSLGDIARKAREEKKRETKKATVVFTNDNLPTAAGQVSVVGTPPPPPKAEGEEATTEGEKPKEEAKPETKGADYWRGKFAEQRAKIATAEKELDILQRELNLMQQQYYSDPNEALRQQYARTDINTQTQKINAKREEVAKLRAGLADLEDQLRKEGGDPGWAR